MASRKNLKKAVKLVCGDAFAVCISLEIDTKGNAKDVNGLLVEILKIQNDFVARISHVEKDKAKLFFKKFREDFARSMGEIEQKIIKG